MTARTTSPDDIPASRVALAPGIVVDADVLRFTFTTSQGPGGQNVNKRSTRAQLAVSLDDLPMPADARARLARLAGSKLTGDGVLMISASSTRSQRQNRDACVERLAELVAAALVRPKKRKPTKPSKGAVKRRLESKRKRGDIKRSRSSDDAH